MKLDTLLKTLDTVLGIAELSRPAVDAIVGIVRTEHPALDYDGLNAKLDEIEARGKNIADTADAEIERAKADAATGEQNQD